LMMMTMAISINYPGIAIYLPRKLF